MRFRIEGAPMDSKVTFLSGPHFDDDYKSKYPTQVKFDPQPELDNLRLYMLWLPNMQLGIKFKLYIPKATWEDCNISDQFRDMFNVKAAWYLIAALRNALL
jgi:hypothetical protein